MPADTAPAPMTPGARQGVVAYVAAFAIVLLLLALFGIAMRMSQGGLFTLPPEWFYRLMTAHGAGMVGIMAVGGGAVMWYFLRQYVSLSTGILVTNLVLFLVGAVLLLAGVLAGGFAGGWTFLYPLPAMSNGQWGPMAAAGFLGGLLLIGVGFLLLFLDVARAVIQRYGSLPRALGWPQAFGGSTDEAPPPTVIASTVVAIINVLALAAGATILVMELVNLNMAGFRIDALLAKNLTFFFGHVFINATMYMAVIAVYEILPRYAGRAWKSTPPFLIAWTATLFMVLMIYPHHLLMDFAMPTWALILGQLMSWTSGIPVLAVTAVTTVSLVHRSGLKWDAVSGLLFLSVFGWAAGVVPAIADGTIVINRVMHNTLWVPGHFHFYLILGTVSMILAFALYIAKQGATGGDSALDRMSVWLYGAGGVGFAGMFLYSGKLGIPRRYAVHTPEWMPYDKLASVFAALVIVAMLVFVARFFGRLKAALSTA